VTNYREWARRDSENSRRCPVHPGVVRNSGEHGLEECHQCRREEWHRRDLEQHAAEMLELAERTAAASEKHAGLSDRSQSRDVSLDAVCACCSQPFVGSAKKLPAEGKIWLGALGQYAKAGVCGRCYAVRAFDRGEERDETDYERDQRLATKRDELEREESARKEAKREEARRQEAARKEREDRERQDAQRQEAARREREDRERLEAQRQEVARKEREDRERQDAQRQEAARREREDREREEAQRQEVARIELEGRERAKKHSKESLLRFAIGCAVLSGGAIPAVPLAALAIRDMRTLPIMALYGTWIGMAAFCVAAHSVGRERDRWGQFAGFLGLIGGVLMLGMEAWEGRGDSFSPPQVCAMCPDECGNWRGYWTANVRGACRVRTSRETEPLGSTTGFALGYHVESEPRASGEEPATGGGEVLADPLFQSSRRTPVGPVRTESDASRALQLIQSSGWTQVDPGDPVEARVCLTVNSHRGYFACTIRANQSWCAHLLDGIERSGLTQHLQLEVRPSQDQGREVRLRNLRLADGLVVTLTARLAHGGVEEVRADRSVHRGRLTEDGAIVSDVSLNAVNWSRCPEYDSR